MGSGFRVFVPGTPQTKGSAKAFMRPGAKFPTVMNDNPKNKPWEAAIKGELLSGDCEFHRELPVSLKLTFFLLRPKSHYRTGAREKDVRESAPDRHVSKPDLDKMVRSVKDALKGIAYADDSQVYEIQAEKRYVDRYKGDEGVEIDLDYLTEAEAGR